MLGVLMKVPEGFVFECGNCAWMDKVEVPPEKKKDYPVDRGYCTFNPPAVFPMPQQKKTQLAAMGQQPQVDMIPFMMRPIVEANEAPCGRYAPDGETVKLLGESGGGCEGCDGNCKGSDSCGCDEFAQTGECDCGS